LFEHVGHSQRGALQQAVGTLVIPHCAALTLGLA
jgi:hypothetical protein